MSTRMAMTTMAEDTRTGASEGAGLPDQGVSAGRLPTGRRKPELTENQIQAAVFKHLRTRGAPGIFAFHPKNGNSDMAGRKSGIHVALGVEPGVPDVIVIHGPPDKPLIPMFPLRVFALELKTLSRFGKQPTGHEIKQAGCRVRMRQCGVTTGVAYGLDEALDWLERHGLLIGRRA